jgi:aerotaxis receptor
MRNNQPITQRERTFPAQQRLISTTDAKGVITYCNDAFVDISGFSREELIRAPHNLVRHPDVPAAVFAHVGHTETRLAMDGHCQESLQDPVTITG